MALNATTLSSAVGLVDTQIVVASATGFAAGSIVRIDQELLQVVQSYVSGTTVGVLRGRNGTATSTHPTSAKVLVELSSDLTGPGPQAVSDIPNAVYRDYKSYSAAGAITLPTVGRDAVAFINGTGALAMTIANPTTDQDGSMLMIVGNGKAAHTVTYAAGFGGVGGTADVMTFSATQAQAFQAIAAGGFWNLIGPLATATASVSGPSLA